MRGEEAGRGRGKSDLSDGLAVSSTQGEAVQVCAEERREVQFSKGRSMLSVGTGSRNRFRGWSPPRKLCNIPHVR